MICRQPKAKNITLWDMDMYYFVEAMKYDTSLYNIFELQEKKHRE